MSEQVTTREELDALPDRSVVLDSDGDAWAKEGDIWVLGINRWDAALLLGSAPLAVLHIPGQPHEPQRVQPHRDALALTIARSKGHAGVVTVKDYRCADAALALFAAQPTADPTTAEIRARAWDEGVRTALNHAIGNDDGVTLRLEHLDGTPWANPYREAEGGAR